MEEGFMATVWYLCLFCYVVVLEANFGSLIEKFIKSVL